MPDLFACQRGHEQAESGPCVVCGGAMLRGGWQALMVGPPVFGCSRGHKQRTLGPCRTVLHRGSQVYTCNKPTTLLGHEPSALAVALALRDAAREEAGKAPTSERESVLARMEQRLIEAAVEAGISWDEARKL